MRAATVSRHAHFGFLDVVQLIAPPAALFKPGVLIPALLRGGDPDRNVPPPISRTAAPESAMGLAPAD